MSDDECGGNIEKMLKDGRFKQVTNNKNNAIHFKR